MALHNHLPLSTLVQQLEAAIPTLMKQAQVPGLSLSLIRDAQIIWSSAFGVKQVNKPERVSTQTIFQAASLSKPLFAYATLHLVERGEIELDRPLTSYLPTTSSFDDSLQHRITARIVLCHTTGWPNWREKGQPLRRSVEPGKQFGYSGEGFGYLQQVVEHVMGQSLETFMQKTVLNPLRMSSSSYPWTIPDDADTVTGHDQQGKLLLPFTMVAPHAAASLHTTPSDYAHFLCAMLQPDTIDGTLPLAWIEEMLRPQIQLEPGIAWGLGWGLQQTEDEWAFWHSGDNPGFKNFTLVYPETQMGIVIMTNGDGGANLWEPLLRISLGGEYPLFLRRAR